jgi:hypothetical protein
VSVLKMVACGPAFAPTLPAGSVPARWSRRGRGDRRERQGAASTSTERVTWARWIYLPVSEIGLQNRPRFRRTRDFAGRSSQTGLIPPRVAAESWSPRLREDRRGTMCASWLMQTSSNLVDPYPGRAPGLNVVDPLIVSRFNQ